MGKDEKQSLLPIQVKAQHDNGRAFNTERTEEGFVSKNPRFVFG